MVLVTPVRGEITVVIADDLLRIRSAVAGVLGQESDFRVVAVVADGDDAVTAAREHRAALVLTDVWTPGGPGASALPGWRARITTNGTASVSVLLWPQSAARSPS